MNPFDYTKTINQTKEDIMVDDLAEKGYKSFIINRSFSYFPDTVFMANAMNYYHQIDNRLQYDFLRHIVRKGNRYSKWTKADQNQYIQYIKQEYGYSDRKAWQALELLGDSNLRALKKKYEKHGRKS